MSERVALVTGAGTGLGACLTHRLLTDGCRVVAHYRTHHERLQALQSEFGAQRCLPVQADFSAPGALDRFLGEVAEVAPQVDILINNAALIERIPMAELNEADLQRTLLVNTTIPFLLGQRLLPGMQERGWGRICTVSSIGIKFSGSPQTAHYMLSKAAVEAGTLALAKAAAPSGVLVNVVRAGVMLTQVQERLGRVVSDREKLIPLGRGADPEEVAEVLAFLVSEHNTYLTGAVIPVAGGE